MRKLLLSLALIVVWPAMASAQITTRNDASAPRLSRNERTQIALGGFSSHDFPLLNIMKAGQYWNYYNNPNAFAAPSDLDTNGYPLYGSPLMVSGRGAFTGSSIFSPSQFSRPGNYVVTWQGAGRVGLSQTITGGTATLVAGKCTEIAGKFSGVKGVTCDNSGCSTFEGYITAGNPAILTVTQAPTGSNCLLQRGQPFSNAAAPTLTVSKFGTPTIITSSGTTGGSCQAGATCYTINFSQSVGSNESRATFNPGGRVEMSVSGETSVTIAAWQIVVFTSGSSRGTPNNNYVQNIGIYYSCLNLRDFPASCADAGTATYDDEEIYWTGAIVSPKLKTVFTSAGWSVLRDLGLVQWLTYGNITTWASRKPAAYYQYNVDEMRDSIYAGDVDFNGGGNPTMRTAVAASFTGSMGAIFTATQTGTQANVACNGGICGVLNVTAVTRGYIGLQDRLTGAGILGTSLTDCRHGTCIYRQIDGTPGGVGHYLVSQSTTASSSTVTSYSMLLNVTKLIGTIAYGQMLNENSGFNTGSSNYIDGMYDFAMSLVHGRRQKRDVSHHRRDSGGLRKCFVLLQYCPGRDEDHVVSVHDQQPQDRPLAAAGQRYDHRKVGNHGTAERHADVQRRRRGDLPTDPAEQRGLQPDQLHRRLQRRSSHTHL